MPAVQLADARILGTIGRFAVQAAKHEVDLADHSLHVFRFVCDGNDTQPRSTFMRAITLPDGVTYVVDVRKLAPCLAQDMPPALDRDRPGLIKYTLRPMYLRADVLYRRVLDSWHACGWLDQQLAARAA